MGMRDLYKEVMALNMMDDNDDKEAVAKTFFQNLNTMKMPQYFNWAADIFDGLHVREGYRHPAEKNLYLWRICGQRQ